MVGTSISQGDGELAENRELRIPVPSLINSTAVLAFVAIVSAIVTFVWVFMAEAQDLKDEGHKLEQEQLKLGHSQDEIRDLVNNVSILANQNAEAIKANTEAIKANATTLNGIAEIIGANSEAISQIESNISYLVCTSENEDSDTKKDCSQYLK